jgi:uncharacterized membrane protein YqjE
MEATTASVRQLAATSKQMARRLLTLGENRLELLAVELQEERERLLRAFLLALAVAVFGLLAALTLTAAIVLCFPNSLVAALLTLTVIYATSAIILYRRVLGLLRDWQSFAATLDQFRKDRQCLEDLLH